MREAGAGHIKGEAGAGEGLITGEEAGAGLNTGEETEVGQRTERKAEAIGCCKGRGVTVVTAPRTRSSNGIEAGASP